MTHKIGLLNNSIAVRMGEHCASKSIEQNLRNCILKTRRTRTHLYSSYIITYLLIIVSATFSKLCHKKYVDPKKLGDSHELFTHNIINYLWNMFNNILENSLTISATHSCWKVYRENYNSDTSSRF